MDEDFEVVRTRKWGESGSDEKLLWLAYLPSSRCGSLCYDVHFTVYTLQCTPTEKYHDVIY